MQFNVVATALNEALLHRRPGGDVNARVEGRALLRVVLRHPCLTPDVALALRQPLVASVGVDTISAPVDESIDISVDYAHLECEEIDQSISTALKEARLQLYTSIACPWTRKCAFNIRPSTQT